MAAPTTTAAAPKQNRIGLTVVDYRGGKTTLCAGCGHNAISERILEACYDLGIPPERVAKFSGIGCSSKSPAYFLSRSHAFNSVHGRMPSVATGALLANKHLLALGRLGRRRHGLHRHRPVRAPRAPQPPHGLRGGEQRRVRPHQGAVLGHRRHGLGAEGGRGERPAAHRHLRARHPARRHVRGAQLLRATRSSSRPCSRRRWSTGAPPSSTCSAPASPSTTTRARRRATPS